MWNTTFVVRTIQHTPGSASPTNQAFLTLARGMLAKATEQKELLVSRGMSEQLLDDLAAALTQFEHTLEATRAAKREHVGASADLDSVVSEISQQVRLLDGLVRYRFGGNAELMGAWASARNVAGAFRSPGGPGAGGVAPAGRKAARGGASPPLPPPHRRGGGGLNR